MDVKPNTGENTLDAQIDLFDVTSEQFDSSLLQKATPEYLQELLKDKKQLQSMPNSFKHVELVLEKEIAQVRERLFHKNGTIQKSNTELPDPMGQIITLQRKVYIPVKENPTYNFVGRLLGPRGLTAKQMEQDLGCKIMVRGKGSMRDKRKEDQNRGKPNWEHLQEDLHVLASVEDYENRAELRLQRAVTAIQIFLEQGLRTPEDKDLLKQTQLMELAVLNVDDGFLSPPHPPDDDTAASTSLMETTHTLCHHAFCSSSMPEGADDIKKRQLMELAIMNGTYREPQSSSKSRRGHVTVQQQQQHSPSSSLSPASSTLDDLDHKDRQQAHTQQLNQQHQQQMLLQQHYMTTMFGNPHPAALAAAAAALSPQLNPAAAQLALNPAAAALAFRGFQATPNVTATTPPGSSAALLAAAAAAATGNPSAAAVVPPPGFPVSVGGMPTGTVSPVSTAPSSTVFPGVAVTQAMAAGLPSDQLVAMLSAAGATGGFDAGQSMAMAGFPANFTQFFPGAAAAQSSAQTSQQASRDASSAIGDYSRSIELDSGSGSLKLKASSVTNVRMHPYFRQ